MLTSLDGLKSAYARKYMSADELGFATPVAASSTPAASSGVSVLTITVLEFENETQASATYRLAANPMIVGAVAGESDTRFERKGTANLGDKANLYMGKDEQSRAAETTGILFVLDGNLGYIITGSGPGPDEAISETLSRFATFMLKRDPGTEDVTLHQQSTATGSTFDLMPTRADRDVIGDLVPMYDYDLLNQGESPMENDATPAT